MASATHSCKRIICGVQSVSAPAIEQACRILRAREHFCKILNLRFSPNSTQRSAGSRSSWHFSSVAPGWRKHAAFFSSRVRHSNGNVKNSLSCWSEGSFMREEEEKEDNGAKIGVKMEKQDSG